MVADTRQPRRHFILDQRAATEPFSHPPRRFNEDGDISRQNRQTHGQDLLQQFNELKPVVDQARSVQQDAGLERRLTLPDAQAPHVCVLDTPGSHYFHDSLLGSMPK